MITLKEKSRRSNTMELEVFIIAKSLQGVPSLEIFKHNFLSEIKNIRKTNCYTAEYSYKLFETTNECVLELWHVGVDSNKKRLVAIVEDDKMPAPDPFADIFK